MTDQRTFRIAVIGAGPAGIAAGRELLRQGFSHVTVFDEQDAPGGTWRRHSYPGLACDVWAHSYSFSYAPNPDWSASFVGQAEIQAYLARSASVFGLDPYLRLNTRIVSARYREDGSWQLRTHRGERLSFDVVISAMGNQHTALYPEVPGMARFNGDSWHSIHWNHEVDLTGRRVVVVGSAASAVQIVPEIAEQAGHLTVLQRSANWIMPRGRKLYSVRLRAWLRRFPLLISLLRRWQGALMHQVYHAVTLGHRRMGQFERVVRRTIERSIEDPALRRALTPDTRYGCRRGLVSDEFYATLCRDDVELVASALSEVTTSGVITTAGKSIEADVIIYCTGYRILDYDRFEVIGEGGRNLAEVMGDQPRAHKGIAVPGFPNFFLTAGPNGLVLTVPYFRTVEKSVQTIVRLLSDLRAAGARRMVVKEAACDEHNRWMSDRFARFSWGASDCNSYYRNASGHAPFLFPGHFREFSRLHDQSGLHEYEVC